MVTGIYLFTFQGLPNPPNGYGHGIMVLSISSIYRSESYGTDYNSITGTSIERVNKGAQVKVKTIQSLRGSESQSLSPSTYFTGTLITANKGALLNKICLLTLSLSLTFVIGMI